MFFFILISHFARLFLHRATAGTDGVTNNFDLILPTLMIFGFVNL